MEKSISSEVLLARRYRVLGTLGEGGMGSVLRVHDTLTDREIALKKIVRPGTEPSQTRTLRSDASVLNLTALSSKGSSAMEPSLRFKMEFRSMSRLKHPNTVSVLDFGVLEDGAEFLTMELVPGQELKDILRTRPLSYPEIYRILSQLCQVLNFIHSRHMIHRDLKPSNIRITPEGDMKLMDFGLMQQMGLPSNGEITGTISYLPPETVIGGIMDARSDLYSLGALAYELVVGHPPFRGSHAGLVIKKHLEEAPPSLKNQRSDVPEGLERFILKLLAKDQEDRYQNVPELWEDLSALSGEKISLGDIEQKKSYLNCSQLIGRKGDFEILKKSLEKISENQGASVFLAASAGMGKSRLVQELKLRAQMAEIPFLTGHCTERSMQPYEAFRQAFRTLLHWGDPNALKEHGNVLVKLLPELAREGFVPLPVLDPVAEKIRLYDAVARWIQGVAQKRPFVLCLEDLHWADIGTLELLNVCIAECRSSGVFFLGAYRSDETESRLVTQTQEEGFTQILSVSPLEENHVKDMIENMLGKSDLPEEFSKETFKATGGNPFFVSEVMRALIEEETLKLVKGKWYLPIEASRLRLPGSIQDTIRKRLGKLSEEALKLARAASCMGRDLDLAFLKGESGVSEDHFFAILEELVEKQFLQRSGSEYRFAHDRVVETLYEPLPEDFKRQTHVKIGHYLEKLHIKNWEPILGLLASHYDKGDDRAKVANFSILAGLKSYQQSALVEAAQHLKRGVEVLEGLSDYPDKKWWLLEAREKLYMASFFHDGILCTATCEQFLKELHDLAGGERVIKTAVGALRVVFKAIDLLPKSVASKIKKALNQPPKPYPIGRGAVWKLAAKLDIGSTLSRIITCQTYYIIICAYSGNFAKAPAMLERSLRYLPDPHGVLRAAVLVSHSSICMYTGRLGFMRDTMREAVRLFQENEDQLNRDLWYMQSIAAFSILYCDTWAARKTLSESSKTLSTSIAEKFGFYDVLFWNAHFVSTWHHLHGRHKEYLERLEEGTRISRKVGKAIIQEQWRLAVMTMDAIQTGELTQAEQILARWEELIVLHHDYFNQGYAQICRGQIAQERGLLEEALSHYQKAVALSRPNIETLKEGLYRSGDVLIRLNRLEEAEACLKEALTVTLDESVDNPYRLTYIHRLMGQLEQKKKRYAQAEEHFQKAMSLCQECGNVYEEALTCVALVSYHSERGQKEEAIKRSLQAKSHLQSLGNSHQIKNLERSFRSQEKAA